MLKNNVIISNNIDHLLDVTAHFAIEGVVNCVSPFGNGLINDSYFIETKSAAPNYILQQINHKIFQDVDMLQDNIDAVTCHIREKLTEKGEKDIDRKVLRFIPSNEGKKYYFDGENYWRLMLHIPNSISYETINPEYSRYAGLAFGEFQSMLSDLPVELGETIPNFHNMEFRLQQFHDAIRDDKAGRLGKVRKLIQEIEANASAMTKAERLHRQGKLPKRVCHCDTKVNNILFDENGGILCVIDLDTVMPSYIFSDYGDFLRSGANTGDEDDRNLDRVNFSMEIFEAFTQGYLKSAGGFLTEIEVENLPFAATMFPYMQAVRFLTDYINGDTYYKIQYPQHNLVRTKAQLKLFKSAGEAIPAMQRYIESIWNKK